MKNGESCNLPEIMALHPEFGMTREEIDAVLEPSLYIGRCPEQVEKFVESVKGLYEGIDGDNGKIEI